MIKKVSQMLSTSSKGPRIVKTHNLKLYRHDPKVQHLHRRPDDEVCLQRGDIHVPELLLHVPPRPALGDRHEGEETGQTDGREQELVERDALQRRRRRGPGGEWKRRAQEAEPFVLQRCHDETVGHEAGQALKVKRGWEALAVGDQVFFRPGDFAVQLVNLDCEAVDFGVGAAGSADGVLAHGCEELGDCVCDATEHLLFVSIPSPSDDSVCSQSLTALVIMVVSTAVVS